MALFYATPVDYCLLNYRKILDPAYQDLPQPLLLILDELLYHNPDKLDKKPDRNKVVKCMEETYKERESEMEL